MNTIKLPRATRVVFCVAVAGVAMLACVSTPLPPRGVSVDELQLTAEPLVEISDVFPESRGLQHVLEIREESATSEIRVVGSHGVAWFDLTGRLTRAVPFEGAERLFPARSFEAENGALGVVGLISESFGRTGPAGRGKVVVFDADGRRRSELPANYASAFFLTSWASRADTAVAVESVMEETLRLYDLDGRQLDVIEGGGDITRTFPADVNDDGHPEVLVYTYPAGEAARVRVIDRSTGQVRDTWPAPILGGFVPGTTTGGAPGILTMVGEELRIYGFGGEILESLPFPNAHKFADLESLLLPDGRRVTLATGGGSLYGHTVLVHEGDGRLVYQRVEKNRAHGLAAMNPAGEATIYYGVGGVVWALHGV